MTTNASRAPIDFDAFERELQDSSSPRSEPRAKTQSDPLAELARIVGQDDPFRALLAARNAEQRPAPAPAARIEPSFYEAAPAPTGPDAFDQYLASVQRNEEGEEPYEDPAAFESDDQDYSNAAATTARPTLLRGKMVQVGAGLGVLALCVTGAFAWKSFGPGGAGRGPVTVLADKTPLKVAPEKADGVDIPDQNKQIYDRTAKDGQIKVVNREEQPIDVAQAARAAASRDGQGGVTPGGGLLTDSLGQPRRIRTVAVKPDTPPPAMPQREASADPAASASPVSPIPTMTMPDTSSPAPSAAASSTPVAAPRAPSRSLASNPVPPKPQPAPAAQSAEAAPEPAAPTPAPRKAIQRVASVAPETTASTIEPEAKAAPTPSATAAIGGFSVQLGVRDSEADAHAAFRQMQGKYAQLSGKPELIRQAEVNGKSIYRVRVGPLAKNEATSLCTELKGAGGQCFVAKN